jgi:hypothetical protein
MQGCRCVITKAPHIYEATLKRPLYAWHRSTYVVVRSHADRLSLVLQVYRFAPDDSPVSGSRGATEFLTLCTGQIDLQNKPERREFTA